MLLYKRTANAAIFCINVESTKVSVFALVDDSLQAKGLRANDWVTSAIFLGGGKGGGKPGQAQGSCENTNNVDVVLDTATKYCETILQKPSIVLNTLK